MPNAYVYSPRTMYNGVDKTEGNWKHQYSVLSILSLLSFQIQIRYFFQELFCIKLF